MTPTSATRFLCTVAAAAATAACAQISFHVSPNGDDNASGSANAPFRTLQRARTALRDARRQNPQADLEVVLAPGRFQLADTLGFQAEDSGASPEHPTVWRAQAPGQTRIAGSTDIPAEAFHNVTDPAVLKRLDPAAAPQILVADLTALGIPKPSSAALKRWNGVTILPELFFNDTRMSVARWPDRDWTTIERIVDPGSKANEGTVLGSGKKPEPPRGGTFQFREDRPLRWDVSKGVYLRGYWCFDWSEEVIRAAAIDKENKTITLATQHHYGLRQGNPSPRRWYALNILEELTAPGEFFLDAAANLLYFIPPAPLANATIRLTTTTKTLLDFNHVHDVVLRGLVVEDAHSGLNLQNCDRVRIEACTVRNMHLMGITINNGHDCVVHSCDVHDTGTGGIALIGGDRKQLLPQRHLVENCHIHHFSVHKLTYSNAISLCGIANTARHNLIHDAPHMAISMSGNDGVFENNVIHHVCLAADDSGALYKGRNPALRGNIIRHNLWHSIGRPMGHGVAAIYFDDGDVGDFVIGNIFFRCGDPGRGSFGTVFCHGGHNHLTENNIFIECKRPLGSAPWNDQRWKNMIDGQLWQTRLLKDVNITQPPYITRYPDFAGFMTPQPGTPRVSQARKNLFVMCAAVKSGNWQVDDSNWSTSEDPGFIDLNHGNFNFRKDAAVFTRIPGFQPPPVDKMGLYACPLRPQVTPEPWTLEPPKQLPPLVPPTRAPAAYVRKPKDNPPVHKVARLAAAPAIDGTLNPAEWNGLRPADAITLAYDYSGTPAPDDLRPQAWIGRDDTTLYVAVRVPVSPNARLNTNNWGQSYAVEIACKKDDDSLPVTVARGYANGFFYFGVAPHGNADPLNQEPAPARFIAKQLDATTWTAEFAIPFAKFGFDPANLPRACFNITVRNPDRNLWIMWEPTRSNSNNAQQAGRLVW